jgi:hypothetical protein
MVSSLPARYPGHMKTQAERTAEKRLVKQQELQRQLDEGSLTIRAMTAQERKRFPPRPSRPAKAPRR